MLIGEILSNYLDERIIGFLDEFRDEVVDDCIIESIMSFICETSVDLAIVEG
jgi:hypothetical protein